MTTAKSGSDQREWTIDVGDAQTRAVYNPADAGTDAPVFVCAHGAGGNMADRGLLALDKVLRANGLGVVRFNFLYKAKGSSRPDQMPKLEQCFSAVVARVREEVAPKTLIIGGRSMGGRAASMMAAGGFPCDALLLFAYPLHPPGQPEKLRDAHLPSIQVPVLCFSGTRDPFCTPELMKRALEPVKIGWQMEWIDAADHSFHVPKSSGKKDADVLQRIGEVCMGWVADLRSGSGNRA